MIERWLQITCDECGETDNSTAPNMSVREFLVDMQGTFIKRGRWHLCNTCAATTTDPKPGPRNHLTHCDDKFCELPKGHRGVHQFKLYVRAPKASK